MNELFLVRIFIYSLFPLLLATGHILLSKEIQTTTRRIEIFLMYLLAISVGANGLGGAFGHLFLSDLVANGIGWETGSPFQLEMGFANLALGIIGIMAMGRRGDFRLATIIVTTIIGGGATVIHFLDIMESGNLAAGNTIQNIGNLLDPVLLISLTWWSSRISNSDVDTVAFRSWQSKQQPIIGLAAAGIGIGFGIGYSLDALLLVTLISGFLGAGMGVMMVNRHTNHNALSVDYS